MLVNSSWCYQWKLRPSDDKTTGWQYVDGLYCYCVKWLYSEFQKSDEKPPVDLFAAIFGNTDSEDSDSDDNDEASSITEVSEKTAGKSVPAGTCTKYSELSPYYYSM